MAFHKFFCVFGVNGGGVTDGFGTDFTAAGCFGGLGNIGVGVLSDGITFDV